MTRTALRALISDLDARIFDLDLALTDSDGDFDLQVIALNLQHLLDRAQQQLDDARKDG